MKRRRKAPRKKRLTKKRIAEIQHSVLMAMIPDWIRYMELRSGNGLIEALREDGIKVPRVEGKALRAPLYWRTPKP